MKNSIINKKSIKNKKISTDFNTKILITFLSVIFIFVLWIIIGFIVDSPLIFPLPSIVFKSIEGFLFSLSFWEYFLKTFIRIIISFLISVIAGSSIGILCGTNKYFKQFLEFPIAIVRVTPVVTIILIAIFWFTSNTVPVFVSVLMTLPLIITSVTNGFLSQDNKLIEMAQVFNISKSRIFFKIKIPFVLPYFFTGIKNAFGLTWKVVAAAEILCIPKESIGILLHNAQSQLETPELFAITIIFVVINYLCEILISMIINFVNK